MLSFGIGCRYTLTGVLMMSMLGQQASAQHERSAVESFGFRVVTVPEFTQSLQRTGLSEVVNQARSRFEVVFVPGILGSQLKIGAKTYGIDMPDSKWLSFDPAQDVQAATLNTFRVAGLGMDKITLTRQDIYGVGLDLLSLALNRRPIEFAYDWRADPTTITNDFAKLMTSQQLRGKKVLIVAHSMGGLIVWNWLKKTEKKRDVRVVGAVFLGSPLRGSCEAARMLLQGYAAVEDSNVWEAVATRTVFKNAHAAMFTFPSLFALLPAEEFSCLSKQLPDGTRITVSHFSEEFWMGRPGAPKGNTLDLHANAGMTREAYTARVRSALNAGRRFRQELDLSAPRDVRIYTVYSTSRVMHENVAVRDSGDWYRVTGATANVRNGDGRVLAVSAMNQENLKAETAYAYEVDLDHGALLSDPKFARFVRNFLLKRVAESVYSPVVSVAATAEMNIGSSGPMAVGSPLIAFEPLEEDAEAILAKRALAVFNVRQAGGQDDLPMGVVFKPNFFKTKGIAKSAAEVGNFQVAGTLYDAIFTLDNSAFSPVDYENAAISKLNAGEIDSAFRYAVAGLKVSSDTKTPGFRKLISIIGTAKERSDNMLIKSYSTTEYFK